MDRPIRRENLASGPSGVAWLPLLATAGEMARQLFGLSFGAVDVGIDRLVADTHRLAIKAKAARDLFRCPTDLQSSNNMCAQFFKADQFATPCAPSICGSLSGNAVVAIQLRQLCLSPLKLCPYFSFTGGIEDGSEAVFG